MLRGPGQFGRRRLEAIVAAAAAAIVGFFPAGAARASDVSAPVVLQDFENTYSTIQSRMADIFNAGYGSIYLPPVGRAESGNQSVGYDQYDRFDLGSPGNPTLYGTETGLKALVAATHTMGGSAYVDMVWNHSGFSDAGTDSGGFAKSGGYPGLALTLQTTDSTAAGYNTSYSAIDGDYHSPYDSSDQGGRLAGLVDIDQSTNYVFIRNPVTVGDSRNIPGPAITGYDTKGRPIYYSDNGRQANIPTASNARFYPTISNSSIYQTFTDTATNGDSSTFKVYGFDNTNPLSGTAVPENALGYLMRNTQWLVQSIGVDGFRIDAAKEMPSWVLNYYDRAVFKSSYRTLLNGQQESIFGFSEVYTGDTGTLESYIRKDLNMDSNNVGGNRDVLDFPLYFALSSNLTGNGYNNDWNNIVNSSINFAYNGTHDGSVGVSFVANQDNNAPSLANVAYAYTMLQPGNTTVYYNAKEFGDGRDFPKDGRGDALGGTYGSAITTLVDIRNRYGRGNYIPRLLEKENYAYERDDSAIVLLSNRTDAGYDSRTITTDFAPGTYLLEQTGNAASSAIDPDGDIPQLLQVNADHTVNVRFLRNSSFDQNGNSFFTGNGYLIYGVPTPQGSMNVSNVASVMAGGTAAASSTQTLNQSNATTRLANISVITAGTFTISLNTVQVNLLGSIRDHNADGDNAKFKIDGGISIKGQALDVTPGDVAYGFEQFSKGSDGYDAASGNGSYQQVINTDDLADGYHYITIEAYRHRDAGEPVVFTDWKQTIYVDRHKPVAAFDSINPVVYTDSGVTHYDLNNFRVRSVDQLANNMHLFLDLPSGLSNAQIMAMISDSNNATQIDTDLYQLYSANVTKGNHVITAVTYKPDGNYNIQRFVGINNNQSPIGAAMGDAVGQYNNTPDGYLEGNDVKALYDAIRGNGQVFYAEDDFNGDGNLTYADWQGLGAELTALKNSGALNAGGTALVSQGTIDYFNSLTSTVPEPVFAAPMALAGLSLLRRKRQSRQSKLN